jgi:hypothetical protein
LITPPAIRPAPSRRRSLARSSRNGVVTISTLISIFYFIASAQTSAAVGLEGT